MRRLAILLLSVAALAAAGVFGWLYFSLDGVVRREIVGQIEAATGVEVHLGAVRLNAAAQKGELRDFRLANPPGYVRDEALLSFSNADVTLDVATLRSEVVHVRQVHIEGMRILYAGGPGGNNLKALAARVAERSTGQATTGGCRVSIDALVIADACVRLALPGVHADVEIKLGDIRWNNLGGAGGAAPGEIMETISADLSRRVTIAVIASLPRTAVEAGLSPEKLAELLGLPVPGAVKEAAGFLRGLFGH